jgi:hypothetical protein
MSENIKVKTTPIQRNNHDVAIELLNIHTKYKRLDPSEIDGLYAQYFALAKSLDLTHDLTSFLNEDISKKLFE